MTTRNVRKRLIVAIPNYIVGTDLTKVTSLMTQKKTHMQVPTNGERKSYIGTITSSCNSPGIYQINLDQ